jgi:deferrochelatase/peroxidase EfeB
VSTTSQDSAVDYADMQGVLRFGHGKLVRACFHALRIRDAAAARDWLRRAPVATAATQSPLPVSALQVALTASGLTRLGVPDRVVAAFSPEFVAGMAGDESRSRRLGDVGGSAPAAWRWGARALTPDVLVMQFATEEAWPAAEAVTREAAWHQAFETIASLRASAQDGNEPFGFADGISQPEVDWGQSRAIPVEAPAYTNVSALGEFVLGYANEYRAFTERPLLDPEPGTDLPAALDAPGRLDLGRHGTYLVLRELSQDVRGFWRYAHAQAESAPDARRLAEAMVGRTIGGEPLVPPGGPPIPGVDPARGNGRLNQFLFSDDPHGEQCPRGAHIRRANPRSGDFAGPAGGPVSRLVHRIGFGACGWRDDRVASTRFHRILRRGRRFGPGLTPEAALQPAPADDPERGIYFVCLNANIGRQFEFVQNAWLTSASFDGLSDESDPLLGPRDGSPGGPCDTFTVPLPGGGLRRLYGVPDFVAVRGGAYFFLPGIRALRYLVTVGGQA